MVQVIRNEYVTNVPVRVLGDIGPERVQITGLFRALRRTDRVVVGPAPGRDVGPLWRRGRRSRDRGNASRSARSVVPRPASRASGRTRAGPILAPPERRTGPAANRAKPATRPPSTGSAPF